ncbi:MAG TPA: uracil-DNA glycosylase [Nitrosarchaeum sp.]|nr:uracil-DNA glycosylase [Nitrosarchaeum sp.]
MQQIEGKKIYKIEKSIFDLSQKEAQILAFPVTTREDCEKKAKLLKRFDFFEFSGKEEVGRNKLFGSKKDDNRHVLAMYAKSRSRKTSDGEKIKKNFSWFNGVGIQKDDNGDWWFKDCLSKIPNIKGIKSIAFSDEEGECSNWNVFYEEICAFAKKHKNDIKVILAKKPLGMNVYKVEKLWTELDQLTYINSDYIREQYKQEVKNGGVPEAKNKMFLRFVNDFLKTQKVLKFDETEETVEKPENPSKEFLTHVWDVISNNELFNWRYLIESFGDDPEEQEEEEAISSEDEEESIAEESVAVESDADDVENLAKEEDDDVENLTKEEGDVPDKIVKPKYILSTSQIAGGWKDFFDTEDVKIEIEKNMQTINSSSAKIRPEPANVFRVFEMPPKDIKVILVGQDPYVDGNAIGYSFAIPNSTTRVNASLQNIVKAITSDENISPKPNIPNNYDTTLKHWRDQGVFLINIALTVEDANPGSHINMWTKFARLLFGWLSTRLKSAAIVLLGGKARDFAKPFFINEKFRVYEWGHPSPTNRANVDSDPNAFWKSNLFSKINTGLVDLKLGPIDWSLSKREKEE